MKGRIAPIVAFIVVLPILGLSASPWQADNESARPPATDAQKQPKFRMTLMSDGIVKSGAHFGAMTFVEENTGEKVLRYNVYLDSADAAKKELADEVAESVKAGGKLNLDKSSPRAEQRTEILLPAKKGCAHPTHILFADGKILRIVTSCSAETARQFETYLRGDMDAADQHRDAR